MTRRMFFGVAAALVVVCLADLILAWLSPAWAPFTDGLGLVVTIMGFFISFVSLILYMVDRKANESPAVDPVVEIVSVQRKRWTEQLLRRGLRSPPPIAIAWSNVTDTAVRDAEGVDWLAVMDPLYTHGSDHSDARPASFPLGPDGSTESLVLEYLRGQPPDCAQAFRRLAVLGKPGAGKTVMMMQLCLDLLERLEGQAPYLHNIAGWNPATPLFDWLADQIVRDCLEQPTSERRSRIRASVVDLLLQGRIVPILDGLDELDTDQRKPALDAIRQTCADTPLVLSCRTREFFDIAQAGGGMGDADYVVVQDIPLDDALRYLAQGVPAATAEAWRLVGASGTLDFELAEVLGTPLLVGLARAVFSNAISPEVLLAAGRFTSSDAVEGFLIDTYLDLSAPRSPNKPESRLPAPGTPTYIRHLAVLARLMNADADNPVEFRWWRIWDAIAPRTARLMFIAAISSIAAVFSYILFAEIQHRSHALLLAACTACACLTCAVVSALVGAPGRPNKATVRYAGVSEGDFGRSFAFGFFPSLFTAFVYGASHQAGLAVAVSTAALAVFGFTFGLFRLSAPLNRVKTVTSPKEEMLADRHSAMIRATVIAGLAAAFCTLIFAANEPLTVAVGSGAYCGFFVGLGAMLATDWAWYLASLTWMAARGELPWRMFGFLERTYEAQVLRQSGTVYQFRHRNMQKRLLDRCASRHTRYLGWTLTHVRSTDTQVAEFNAATAVS